MTANLSYIVVPPGINKHIRVYVAGPYTVGDPAVNTSKAMQLGHFLMSWRPKPDNGYRLVPFVPHLSHFMHLLQARPYDEWIDQDLVWVCSCDVLFRMDGPSEGADLEVKTARNFNVPVFTYLHDTSDGKKVGLLDYVAKMG